MYCKLTASMAQKRLSEAMDDRIDPAQFSFRKGREYVHPNPFTYIGGHRRYTKRLA